MIVSEFLTVVIVHFIALISPGPDFLIVTKNTLSNNKKVGILISAGLAIGILVHVTLSLTGITLIIKNEPSIFLLLKIVCAIYLLFISFKILKNSFINKQNTEKNDQEISKETRHTFQENSNLFYFRTGFITNVTNPKVALFFLTILTQIVSSNTSVFMKIIYGLEMSLVTFLWFTIVTLFFTKKHIKNIYLKYQNIFETFFAFVLILLVIKFLIL